MAEHEVTVSVIMLTYNQEKYIEQALQSVLAQETAFPFEVLIGDDGSCDGTAEKIAPYLQQFPDKVYYFRRTENMGAARNAYDLLLRGRGTYLAFCEGDDYWTDRHKLQKQVDFLEEHPDIIGCTHRCLLVDEDGTALPTQHLSWVRYKRRFTFRDFQGGRYLPGQTATVVKRNLFCGTQEDWSLLYAYNRHISDRMSTEAYLLRGDFAALDETMSAYRKISRHGGVNLTSRLFKDNDRKCQEELEMTQALEQYAASFLKRKVRFSRKRSDIFLAALIGFAQTRSRMWRNTVRQMLDEMTVREWVCFPLSVLEKVCNKILG